MRYKTLLATALVVGLNWTTAQATVVTIPEGTVTLTQNGFNVVVDVSLKPNFKFVESPAGGGELFLFNDSIAGSSITSISTTPNTPQGGLTAFTNLSPPHSTLNAGSFTASVECVDAIICEPVNAPDMTTLHFTVTNAAVDQITSAVNGAGFAFFADTVGSAAATPEPTTIALLGLGFLG